MLFSRHLSLSALTELCRALRHYLSAGLTVMESFGHLSSKGDAKTRAMCSRVFAQLKQGDSLESALEAEQALLPTIFHSLVVVGEQTGNLPEVFEELEQYFRVQNQLRTRFLVVSIIPTVMFVMANIIISLVLFVLGALAPPGGPVFDPLGLGIGWAGVARFLGISLGSVTLIIGGVLFARHLFRGGAMDRFLLGVPVLGPCLRSLALQRYCLAQRLTLETALSMPKAARISLRATGNTAFLAQTDAVASALKRGDELTVALGRTRLFPRDLLDMMAVGEESGRLPEVLKRQSEAYREESSRRASALSVIAILLVWLSVAALIIVMIFRMFLSYINLLDSFSNF